MDVNEVNESGPSPPPPSCYAVCPLSAAAASLQRRWDMREGSFIGSLVLLISFLITGHYIWVSDVSPLPRTSDTMLSDTLSHTNKQLPAGSTSKALSSWMNSVFRGINPSVVSRHWIKFSSPVFGVWLWTVITSISSRKWKSVTSFMLSAGVLIRNEAKCGTVGEVLNLKPGLKGPLQWRWDQFIRPEAFSEHWALFSTLVSACVAKIAS